MEAINFHHDCDEIMVTVQCSFNTVKAIQSEVLIVIETMSPLWIEETNIADDLFWGSHTALREKKVLENPDITIQCMPSQLIECFSLYHETYTNWRPSLSQPHTSVTQFNFLPNSSKIILWLRQRNFWAKWTILLKNKQSDTFLMGKALDEI